jgi:CRP-like cAMP-binding protein
MNSFTQLKDAESVLPILSKISIFGGATDFQRREIFGRLETRFFKKGDCIFQRGDEPEHIYIVKSGEVDLRITDNEVVLHKKVLEVGECFGEASLMSMHRHTATAIAAADTEIIALARHALNQLRHEDPALFSLLLINIARELARRLKTTDDILLHYLHSAKNGGGSCHSVRDAKENASATNPL